MDLSWVKELADQSNELEMTRQEMQRKQKLQEKQISLATSPFVEKLHVLLSAFTEEFNKHTHYGDLKIVASSLIKRTQGVANRNDQELTYPEEFSGFSIRRKDWIFGVKGLKGSVEFVEIPAIGPQVNLEDAGGTLWKKFVAEVDANSSQIVWKRNDEVVDGQKIVATCQEYFKEFIERTNSEIDEKKKSPEMDD